MDALAPVIIQTTYGVTYTCADEDYSIHPGYLIITHSGEIHRIKLPFKYIKHFQHATPTRWKD